MDTHFSGFGSPVCPASISSKTHSLRNLLPIGQAKVYLEGVVFKAARMVCAHVDM